MQIIKNISELRSIINNTKKKQEIAFIPTMGNLHHGHLSLINKAKKYKKNIFTVVSIFLNPLQFSKNEDLYKYPKTLEEDILKLETIQCDLLYLPEVSDLYPDNLEEQTIIHVPKLSKILCGQHRKNHFDGVTTIVCKLFNIVTPHYAFFGEKDYQQLLLIKKIVMDLNLPLKIISSPTIRNKEGLALSSRNNYLSPIEIKKSSIINETLLFIKKEIIKKGEFNITIKKALMIFKQQSIKIEYLEIRNKYNLKKASANDKELIILIAAYINTTRLIDNISIKLES